MVALTAASFVTLPPVKFSGNAAPLDGGKGADAPGARASFAQSSGQSPAAVPPAGDAATFDSDSLSLLQEHGNHVEEEAEDRSEQQPSEDDAENDAELSEDEEEVVEEMAARDREVRAHEQAHAAVGGQYAGSPSYQFDQGPDGKRYAVSGEVPIDVSPVSGDPEATIRKMETVKRAALAPAEPSGQDRAVASTADALKMEAVGQLREQRVEEAENAEREESDPAIGDAAVKPATAEKPDNNGRGSGDAASGDVSFPSVYESVSRSEAPLRPPGLFADFSI